MQELIFSFFKVEEFPHQLNYYKILKKIMLEEIMQLIIYLTKLKRIQRKFVKVKNSNVK